MKWGDDETARGLLRTGRRGVGRKGWLTLLCGWQGSPRPEGMGPHACRALMLKAIHLLQGDGMGLQLLRMFRVGLRSSCVRIYPNNRPWSHKTETSGGFLILARPLFFSLVYSFRSR